jgi:mannose-6-phosphate isomerase-like protein (cupin superfamily)
MQINVFYMEKVNVRNKFAQISDFWNPRIAGELNGQMVKLVKFQGEFVWHKHDDEDEMFYVVEGEFNMELRDQTIVIRENEFIIIPRGVEHRPVAPNEVSVILFEPASTLNTGDTRNDLTKEVLERI